MVPERVRSLARLASASANLLPRPPVQAPPSEAPRLNPPPMRANGKRLLEATIWLSHASSSAPACIAAFLGARISGGAQRAQRGPAPASADAWRSGSTTLRKRFHLLMSWLTILRYSIETSLREVTGYVQTAKAQYTPSSVGTLPPGCFLFAHN